MVIRGGGTLQKTLTPIASTSPNKSTHRQCPQGAQEGRALLFPLLFMCKGFKPSLDRGAKRRRQYFEHHFRRPRRLTSPNFSSPRLLTQNLPLGLTLAASGCLFFTLHSFDEEISALLHFREHVLAVSSVFQPSTEPILPIHGVVHLWDFNITATTPPGSNQFGFCTIFFATSLIFQSPSLLEVADIPCRSVYQ